MSAFDALKVIEAEMVEQGIVSQDNIAAFYAEKLNNVVPKELREIIQNDPENKNSITAIAKILVLDQLRDTEQFQNKGSLNTNIAKAVAFLDLEELRTGTTNLELKEYAWTQIIKINDDLRKSSDNNRSSNLAILRVLHEQLEYNKPSLEKKLELYEKIIELKLNLEKNGNLVSVRSLNRDISIKSDLDFLIAYKNDMEKKPTFILAKKIKESGIKLLNKVEEKPKDAVDACMSKIVTAISKKNSIYVSNTGSLYMVWKDSQPVRFEHTLAKVRAMQKIFDIVNQKYENPNDLLNALDAYINQENNEDLNQLKGETAIEIPYMGKTTLSYSNTYKEILSARDDLAKSIKENQAVSDKSNSSATTSSVINSKIFNNPNNTNEQTSEPPKESQEFEQKKGHTL